MKKTIYLFLLIISMMTMYYFSSQDGATSTIQSNTVIQIIDKVREKVTLQDERLIKIKDSVINKLRKFGKSVVVRKLAHFSIYAVIGGLMMIVINSFTKRVFLSGILSFIFTILFALFDEMRQLSIDGRSGSLTDVFIDSSGALLSIVLLVTIIAMGNAIRYIGRGKKN